MSGSKEYMTDLLGRGGYKNVIWMLALFTCNTHTSHHFVIFTTYESSHAFRANTLHHESVVVHYTQANLKNWSWLDDNMISLLVIITHTLHHHYISPTMNISKSKSKLCYDRWSVCLGVRHPFGAYDQIFITVRQLQVYWCGALFLTREQICRLQLLLALASAIILYSKYHGIDDHILLSQIRDYPILEGQVPVFISPRNRVAQLYPQALCSLFVTS
jgi:hypothetical protein